MSWLWRGMPDPDSPPLEVVTSERWVEAVTWMDRRVREELDAGSREDPVVLEGMAASAWGYSVSPAYPVDDPDEIFAGMLRSREAGGCLRGCFPVAIEAPRALGRRFAPAGRGMLYLQQRRNPSLL